MSFSISHLPTQDCILTGEHNAYQPAVITVVLMNIDRNENRSRIVDDRSTVSPFFSTTVDCNGFPLLAASVLNICVASSI